MFAKLSTLGVQPVLCSDAVFVRRAYLDLIGKLPTAQEAREFIENPTKGKRRELVDGLLERDEYADYWAMAGRHPADQGGIPRQSLAECGAGLSPLGAGVDRREQPYDKFTRELLTSSGSNFRVGPVNFYRAVQNRTAEGIAMAVALALMGSRADGWPEERLQGMAVFFSQIGYKPTGEWKEEIVFWDPLRASATAGNTRRDATRLSTGRHAARRPPCRRRRAVRDGVFPDGTRINCPPTAIRGSLADWLITPENPWLARASSIASGRGTGAGDHYEPDDITRTIRRVIRSCWPTWRRSWWPAADETALPAGCQLQHVPVFLRAADERS